MMIRMATPPIGALLVTTTLVAATLTAPDGAGIDARVERRVTSSQVEWPAGLDELRRDLERDPRAVIEALIAWLDVDRAIPGNAFESQIYQASGNALTLLERLTDYRICGVGRDWLGFSTHDHRGQRHDEARVRGPWKAWLDARKDVPPEQWFFGLSAAELFPLQRLLRLDPASWSDDALAPARTLGKRAWPYLLAMLVEDDYARPSRRLCDQANDLLAKLTGLPAPPIAAVNPLTLPADHPDRTSGHTTRRNHALCALARERWTATLLSR